jgi:phosphopentomutase
MSDQSSEKRVILIVLDSVGVGALPDAELFGDKGANTLAHIAGQRGGLKLPNLQKFGLGNIIDIQGVPPEPNHLASFGKMREASGSKDTMVGHWEIMGLITDQPFPVFPRGFPDEILEDFYKETGVQRVLGNESASGTVIIQKLGEEHIKTGFPILYTSADSVFQIAAHEEIIPIDDLYRMCEGARRVCDRYRIGRVIARPFVGQEGNFTRTVRRKDYPMKPPAETVLDILKGKGYPVVGIGKIEDIYAGQGITRAIHTTGNSDGMAQLIRELAVTGRGLIFINLVDFDMLYGHRNDVEGYAVALETFDRELAGLCAALRDQDLLIITADHGCDPTHPGTDHTREYVPLLVYHQSLPPRDLGTRRTFADIGVSILDFLGIEHSFPGTGFKDV